MWHYLELRCVFHVDESTGSSAPSASTPTGRRPFPVPPLQYAVTNSVSLLLTRHWMHETQTIVIDDPVVWMPVCLCLSVGGCSYSFARWHRLMRAIMLCCIAFQFMFVYCAEYILLSHLMQRSVKFELQNELMELEVNSWLRDFVSLRLFVMELLSDCYV